MTRFVTDVGNVGGSFSPLGITVLPNGNVVAYINGQGKNYVWPNVDGQNLTTAITSTAFSGCCPAYATAGGASWGSQAGNLVKFDNNGAVVASYPSPGVNISNGLWANPVTGHLLAQGSAIYDITITGGVPTNFRTVVSAGSDGLSVSPDGLTVYTNQVIGYNIATGAVTFPLVSVPSGDGTGIISSNNAVNGDIIVNGTDGNVTLIDVHNANAKIIIASSGTRGDYAGADASTGTLFLTQSNEIYRLSCGVGCAVGGTPPPPGGTPSSVPTLSELGLVLLALLLIGSTAYLIGRPSSQTI